jgi:Tol biopolymer transport system component
MTRPRAFLFSLLLLLAAAMSSVPAGAQVAPDARWRTFDTPHFQVHYQDGLEALARRAAARAEEARTALSGTLVQPPRGRVHLVIADNLDYANGLANIFPRNRIVVYAHGPVEEPSLAYSYDWLELVVSHELAHVHHLDYAGPVFRGLRRVLGRNPALFPNASVPQWTTEGLATYLESRLTGAGRVHGSFHDMVLRTAVLEDRFFSIDRVTGRPTSWPSGNAAYVYGSMFEEYLSERYGEDRAGEFVRVMGRRLVPYRVDYAARTAYGTSFTAAWEQWRDSLRTAYGARADSLRAAGLTEPEQLTREGRYTQHPRYSPDGQRLAFAQSTGRDDPATRVMEADGTVRTIAARKSVGPLAWLPDGSGLVTSQLDLVDPYRIYSDLYRVAVDGDVERLTRAARLSEPDVRRDGRMVAVQNGGEANALVLADAEGLAVRPLAEAETGVWWSAPRWSPDGSRIAVSRQRTGGLYDVVVMDTAGRVLRALTEDRALDMTPAWSPDGRYVVFSSDRTGIPNLYAYDLQAGRLLQATNLLTGAFQPDVSPDGRWIAFAWYRSDGYHVARVPFDPSAWRPAPPLRAEAEGPAADPARYARTAGGPARPYTPLATLPPTSWSLLIEPDSVLGNGFGVGVAGNDVLNRHGYAARLTVRGEESRTEGVLAWTYAGLGRPLLGASIFQDWGVAARAGRFTGPDEAPIETALLDRERSASIVATFPRPRFRSYSWLSVGLNLRKIDFVWDDEAAANGVAPPEFVPEVGAVLTVGRSTARGFDFSISQEEGWTNSFTVEGRRFTRTLGDATEPQGYVRVAGRSQRYDHFGRAGFARPVLATRVLAAADVGSRSPGFGVGGLTGGNIGLPLGAGAGVGMGGELDFPVRGYPEAAQLGDRAVAASVEYRHPIALVERGYRLVPAFVNRLWGAAFVDGGAAWCLDDCPRVLTPSRDAEPIFSVGAELAAELTIFFFGDLSLVGGIGVPLNEIEVSGEMSRPNPAGYIRLGRSF